jgi:biotin operon repressor
MTQSHYSTQATTSDQNELIKLRSQLDQALSLIGDLRQERDDAVEREAETKRELEKQLDEKDKRVAWLEKAYLQCKNANKWTDDVINHPHIQQARDRVLLNEFVKRTGRVAPGEDGKWRVSASDLKSATNISEHAIWDGVKSLRSMGFEIETEPIPGKGNHKRYVYDVPQEIKDNPRQAIKPDKSNYGGMRETVLCPNCGSSKNAHSKRNKCADCNHEWGTPWKANNADIAKQAQEEIAKDEEETETVEAETQKPMPLVLFPVEKKPRKQSVAKDDGPEPPPQRACYICGTTNWKWDKVFENYICGTSHKGV